MYGKWLEDLVNDNIRYMTEEQISHFKECAVRLSGNDNLIEAFNKYYYTDFIQLGILNYEEIQILDTITDEIAYMKEDNNPNNDNISEYDKLKEHLSNIGISLVDYELHGDSGMQIISLYFDNNINKWIFQRPVERSNKVRQKEYDTFEDAKEHISIRYS